MIKAVIFDMDGVLIDSEPLWKIAEKKTFKKVGIEMTTEMCNLTMGYRTNEVIEYWYQRRPWTGVTQTQLTDDLIDAVMEEILIQGKILPGVLASLELLQRKGLPIALASSSSKRIIDTVVDKLGIRHFFNSIRSAEFEKFGKPHPAVFISAADDLGISPTSCMVIEDSVNGVIAGKAAKMYVVAVPDPSMSNDPRFVIADKLLPDLTAFNELLLV